MRVGVIVLVSIIMLGAFACMHIDQKAANHRKSIIDANDELLNKGNLDYADKIFAEDYANIGPDGVKQYVRELRAAFPDLQVKVDLIVAEDDLVGWKRNCSGTHSDTLWGYAPSNLRMNWDDFIFSRYEKGKVVEEWAMSRLGDALDASVSHSADNLKALANELVDALNAGDAEAYAKHLYSGLTFFLPQSDGLIVDYSAGEMNKRFANGLDYNIALEDLDVAFFGDMALITGYETGRTRFEDGSVIEGRQKYSSVWTNEEGKWYLVHIHISAV